MQPKITNELPLRKSTKEAEEKICNEKICERRNLLDGKNVEDVKQEYERIIKEVDDNLILFENHVKIHENL